MVRVQGFTPGNNFHIMNEKEVSDLISFSSATSLLPLPQRSCLTSTIEVLKVAYSCLVLGSEGKKLLQRVTQKEPIGRGTWEDREIKPSGWMELDYLKTTYSEKHPSLNDHFVPVLFCSCTVSHPNVPLYSITVFKQGLVVWLVLFLYFIVLFLQLHK